MKNLILLSLSTLLFCACTPQPQAIEYGLDKCHSCKMTIVDAQHAAEAVSLKGKVFKFDAIECLVHYVNEHGAANYSYLLVCDYQNPKTLLPAQSSHFLISKAIPSPMGANLSAFANREACEQVSKQHGGDVMDWPQLLQRLKDQGVAYPQNSNY